MTTLEISSASWAAGRHVLAFAEILICEGKFVDYRKASPAKETGCSPTAKPHPAVHAMTYRSSPLMRRLLERVWRAA